MAKEKLIDNPAVQALVAKIVAAEVKAERKRVIEHVKASIEGAKILDDKVVKKMATEMLKNLFTAVKG